MATLYHMKLHTIDTGILVFAAPADRLRLTMGADTCRQVWCGMCDALMTH